MKFAFSTVACPEWDLKTVIARAKEYGYEGVELRGPSVTDAVATKWALDPLASEAKVIRDCFAEAGVKIACLSNSIAMTGKTKTDAVAADAVRQYVVRAQALGCGLVKIADVLGRRGDGSDKAMAFANWLLPLADYAAERDVDIVIENEFLFRKARLLWTVIDTLNHPAIAACWDVCNAMVNGERPAVSVPTLNSRIHYVHVKDARLSLTGTEYCPIGQGDVPIRDFFTRLSGIGYTGWITFEWDRASLPELPPANEVLPDTLATLRKYAGVVTSGDHGSAAKKPHPVSP